MANDKAEIDRLVSLVENLNLVIEDFLPHIGSCCLQNYERLNMSLLESEKVLRMYGKR